MTSASIPAPDAPGLPLDHWVYGVAPGRGYGVKAQSPDLNLSFYAPKIEGHYTPIRGDTVQASDGRVDVVMLHPVDAGSEILYSVVGPGPADELGRPTFGNHTAIVPVRALRAGEVSLGDVDSALRDFDLRHPEALGEIPRLTVRSSSTGPVGAGLGKFLTRSAAETLLSRLLVDPESRTLLLARESSAAARRSGLLQLFESYHLRCGLPIVPMISDGPTSPQLNHFQVVLSPRGLRADPSWVLLECVLDKPSLPRVDGQETRYQQLFQCFGERSAPGQ